MSQNEDKDKPPFTEKQLEKEILSEKSEAEATENGVSKEEMEIYKQVLEKLAKSSKQEDEKPEQKTPPEDSSVNKSNRDEVKTQIENTIKQDFLKIELLLQKGLINPTQGQGLKQLVLKKAFDAIVQNEKMSQFAPTEKILNKDELFQQFEQEKPDFFAEDNRKEVLDYLKSENVSVGKDDLVKISQIVENLEKSAVERYLRQSSYEKNLLDANELAKQRLTANAQNAGYQDKNLGRVFSREQIGKMTSEQFAKYEPLIMEQLRKGLIK